MISILPVALQPAQYTEAGLQWQLCISSLSTFCFLPGKDRIFLLLSGNRAAYGPCVVFFPKNVHGGFQMFTGFVQQVNVGWVLDISRSHGGIHYELTPIFLLLLFLFQLLFGGVPALFATLGRLPLYICDRRIGKIVLWVLVLQSLRSTFRCCSGHTPVQRYSLILATSSTGKRLRKCTIMEESNKGST